jgi:uncharacterized membrane protein YphA (DoxX/SURF4 family)
MNVVLTQVAAEETQSQTRPWSLATRIAFCFCFVYFVLYCLSNQIVQGIFPIPKVDQPEFDSLWPTRPVVIWVGAHILRLKTPLAYAETGSGDRTWDWVVLFLILITALVATAIWSVLDRRRASYPTLSKWFLLLIRFALAGQMITYGAVKVVPLQMPFPYLVTQIERFGDQSPMGILWSSVGAVPAFETFCGCAELIGGLLLIFPRTITIGALVCLADMIHVFVLNMTYDVPVKLLSFHLILLSLVLLATRARPLANMFLINRTAEPVSASPLFRTQRANRIARLSQAFLWLWILGNAAYGNWDWWYKYGPGVPKSPLYGIWDVVQYTSDGQVRPPLLTDSERWRRLIFQSPDSAWFQRMDDSTSYLSSSIDTEKNTLSLMSLKDKNWKAAFSFKRPSADQVNLEGVLAGHAVQLHLLRVDHTKFLFVSRGFHWVQEKGFNR